MKVVVVVVGHDLFFMYARAPLGSLRWGIRLLYSVLAISLMYKLFFVCFACFLMSFVFWVLVRRMFAGEVLVIFRW